jgi:hypothetical protein
MLVWRYKEEWTATMISFNARTVILPPHPSGGRMALVGPYVTLVGFSTYPYSHIAVSVLTTLYSYKLHGSRRPTTLKHDIRKRSSRYEKKPSATASLHGRSRSNTSNNISSVNTSASHTTTTTPSDSPPSVSPPSPLLQPQQHQQHHPLNTYDDYDFTGPDLETPDYSSFFMSSHGSSTSFLDNFTSASSSGYGSYYQEPSTSTQSSSVSAGGFQQDQGSGSGKRRRLSLVGAGINLMDGESVIGGDRDRDRMILHYTVGEGAAVGGGGGGLDDMSLDYDNSPTPYYNSFGVSAHSSFVHPPMMLPFGDHMNVYGGKELEDGYEKGEDGGS